ncbi:MAG: sigma-54-dependent transcriptional regulator [Bacteroidota bacterium]
MKEHQHKRVVLLYHEKQMDSALRKFLRGAGVFHYYNIHSTDKLAGLCALVARWEIIDNIVEKIKSEELLVGDSIVWTNFLRNVVEVSRFSQCSVLVQGETGTGKEQVCRLIHEFDQRQGKRDLILLDCTTLVPELTGSELYGHEKGAFTNATYTRDGAFALANFGTLFLDEIGELPLGLQPGLLRVLQEGSYKRVGSNEWRRTYFRLVSATNRELKSEVLQRRFREDLYYRINTVTLRVPPLSERRDDIIRLTQYFLKKELGRSKAPAMDEALTKHLLKKVYPGNVRELRQVIASIAFRYAGEGPLTINHLPESEFIDDDDTSQPANDQDEFRNFLIHAIAHGQNLHQIKNTISDVSMRVAIDMSDNNLRDAANLLGIDVRTLQLYRQRTREKSNGHA